MQSTRCNCNVIPMRPRQQQKQQQNWQQNWKWSKQLEKIQQKLKMQCTHACIYVCMCVEMPVLQAVRISIKGWQGCKGVRCSCRRLLCKLLKVRFALILRDWNYCSPFVRVPCTKQETSVCFFHDLFFASLLLPPCSLMSF